MRRTTRSLTLTRRVCAWNAVQDVAAAVAGIAVTIAATAALTVAVGACTAVTFGVCGVALIGIGIAAGVAGAAVTYGLQSGEKSLEGLGEAALAGGIGGAIGALLPGVGPALGKALLSAGDNLVGGVSQGVQAASQSIRSTVRGPSSAQADNWAYVSGIVRDAANGKGNFGLGSATAKEANDAGQAWVGANWRWSSNAKSMISEDGLRMFRPPTYKPNFGEYQANFEHPLPDQITRMPFGDGHLSVSDMQR